MPCLLLCFRLRCTPAFNTLRKAKDSGHLRTVIVGALFVLTYTMLSMMGATPNAPVFSADVHDIYAPYNGSHVPVLFPNAEQVGGCRCRFSSQVALPDLSRRRTLSA